MSDYDYPEYEDIRQCCMESISHIYTDIIAYENLICGCGRKWRVMNNE
jgi:hypothetical protein